MEVSKHRPVSPAEATPYLRWFTQLGLVLCSFGLLYLLWEWYTIGIIADQEKIADYQFETESMLGEGGSHYTSAAAYAAAALRTAVFVCLPLTAVFALAVRNGTRRFQLLAVAAVTVAGLINILL
ncbi:hypothetical protein Hsw_0832 [Hymenobacter swuensis DY53]|uniref:Uncharacterized protein n=2 Tax=Hymenobacter TaxID=89966 RepID=W8EXH0_9BACT|nr:hypothetical protein Hsw_0832 [Hymenobacter swuensis DY53]